MSERTWCFEDDCPDKKKYGTLIYTITCKKCLNNKRKVMNPPVCLICGYPLCSDCKLCGWHCSDELQCECPDTWHFEEDDDQ